MGKRLSISPGDRFGRLVAVEIRSEHKNGNLWLFKCDCGSDYVNRPSQITIGRARSCGCARKKPKPISKFCTGCRTEKPSAEFEGKRNRCRTCRSTNRKNYGIKRSQVDPKWAERRKREGENKPVRAKRMFYSARSSAAARGLSFALTQNDILSGLEKQEWKCARTRIPFDLIACDGKRPFGPTIDRTDSKRGYEPDNIQFVCLMYNTAKLNFTDADVLRFAAAVVEYHRTRE